MPNWVHNTLTVTGWPERIAPFKAQIRSFEGTREVRDGDFIEGETFAEYDARCPTRKEPCTYYDVMESFLPTPPELQELSICGRGGESTGRFTGGSHNPYKKGTEVPAEVIDGYLAKYGARDWHEWACNNWGTKWGDCETLLTADEPNRLVFEFDSAWSSPAKGVSAIAERFPKLRFRLEHYSGENWQEGEYLFGHGELLSQWLRDFPRDDEPAPDQEQAQPCDA